MGCLASSLPLPSSLHHSPSVAQPAWNLSAQSAVTSVTPGRRDSAVSSCRTVYCNIWGCPWYDWDTLHGVKGKQHITTAPSQAHRQNDQEGQGFNEGHRANNSESEPWGMPEFPDAQSCAQHCPNNTSLCPALPQPSPHASCQRALQLFGLVLLPVQGTLTSELGESRSTSGFAEYTSFRRTSITFFMTFSSLG